MLIVRPDGEVIAKNAHPRWLTMDGATIFTTAGIPSGVVNVVTYNLRIVPR